MAESAPAKKKVTKPKVPAAHPKYIDMIQSALGALKERGGSSRQAVLKYIMANFKVGNDPNSVNSHLKLALKSGVAKGVLKQAKGTGASGSFKLGDKPKPAAKKPKTKKVAKPKAAKPKKTPTKAKKETGQKKAAAKKPKKVKTPKKEKAPKAKTTKPKKVKTPKKAKPAPKKTKKTPTKAKATKKAAK